MSTSSTMHRSKVASREEGLAARKELLAKEKEHTRQRDELSRKRRELPWVKVDKDYFFDTPEGQRSLADLFAGRSQLIVYHFMLGPGWEAGCPSCSYIMDHVDGPMVHLNARDITLTAISRAPLAQIQAFKQRMGWQFPWASSHGNSFNFDYHVSFTQGELVSGEVYYNFEKTPAPPVEEFPGLSVFAKDESGDVYHTYSTYARGLDALIGAYQFIDLTPKGRDEDGLAHSMAWVRHHDRYGKDYAVDPNAPYAPPKGSSCPNCAGGQQ
jgi:predicted dithiol-disulfide oxidoreductase (DUF899 family)